MAKKTKKMSTGKKVAIGAGVLAVVGALLCWRFCPCFKKQPPAQDVGTDAVPPQGFGSGFPIYVPEKTVSTPMGVQGTPGREYHYHMVTQII